MLTYADVQVMESARMVFEGLCTRAILLAQKEALKGMGIDEQRPPPKQAPPGGSLKTHVSFGTGEAKSRRYVCSRMLTYGDVW